MIKNALSYCFYLLIITLDIPLSAQENSLLSTGSWVKMGIPVPGIYKIDLPWMQQTGLNFQGMDPANLKVYGYGGGMLPQANDAPRYRDLTENALYAVGLDDGSFDAADYLLFYAEGPDQERITSSEVLIYQKNLYADTSYYFLTIGTDPGKRMTTIPDLGATYPEVNTYSGYKYHEQELENILSSGREWYGEIVAPGSPFTIRFEDLPSLNPGSQLRIVASVLNRSEQASEFQFTVNGVAAGSITTNGIGSGIYDDKGVIRSDTLVMVQGTFPENGSLDVGIAFAGSGFGHIDRIVVNYESPLGLLGRSLKFTSPSSLEHPSSTYKIDNVDNQSVIWDLTEPRDIKIQQYEVVNGQAIFGALSETLRHYVVFTGNDFPRPLEPELLTNQDLHGLETPQLLIVTHPTWLAEAQRLADHRRQHDQLSVEVVTPKEIYNEFSSGRQDVTAIRDFVRYLYNKDPVIKYLLLFGRGSYDYKNITEGNTNFVPTYQSRNSLDPIFSYSSDDYFGFLNDEEGLWDEDLSGTGGHLLEVAVGRLPVTSRQQAQVVVDKLINYAIDENTLGSWRQDIYYVADDGDFNLHQRDADQLATLVDSSYREFNVRKIYVDAFPQVQTPNGESAEGVNQAIDEAVKKGALIINYTGHGSEFRWAEETILNHNMIDSWENYHRLPLFVTATCEFGRHDDPKRVSGAEKLITNPKGGAIGLVTTARPVFASKNFILNRAFYQVALKADELGYPSLGDIFIYTKNDSYTIVANRNFALLGDPSMKLAYPQQRLQITEITKDEGQPGDTIHALSRVRLLGRVVNAKGEHLTNFSGTAEITVFDKANTVETLGSDAGRKFSYQERSSILFRGLASVQSGNFEVNFVVPKNIIYQMGSGKISLYGLSSNELIDAGGAYNSFLIGGSNKNAPVDNTPPQIALYMDDMTFVNGGITGSNTLLLAKISDENGITISNTGFGQGITAWLNEDNEFLLNDFFRSELDSYQSGWVNYPITGLEEGQYSLTLKAWDVHNNSNTATLNFLVVENPELALYHVMNFPNPFDLETTFSIDHNQAGNSLEVEIQIFDRQGKMVHSISNSYANSPSNLRQIQWSGTNHQGAPLPNGLYVYKVIVKSVTTGDKSEVSRKLVIIK